ncbi:D-2-hydroxyacid dehydrogenase [Candidatus Riflebacteria bacterium]
MIKILANDGLSDAGCRLLQEAEFELSTEKVEQGNLVNEINEKKYDAVLVRSATKITKEIIDSCPSLKLIGRGGVGMDNIEVEYAKSKGIAVVNTPAASSASVAELVFAHLFSICRYLNYSNRQLREGDFKSLKKKYSHGIELAGKTLGIIGVGKIGKEVAKRALGLGIKVLATDPFQEKVEVRAELFGTEEIDVVIKLKTVTLAETLMNSDFITVHVPLGEDKKPIIGRDELNKMKRGVILLNIARGGVVDEDALIEALKEGKIRSAGLDVFLNEPKPREDLLQMDNISLSPHIGGSTVEAQARIGIEIAELVINFFKK